MKSYKRICIVGAGFAATSIANEIKNKKIFGSVCLFLDDDPDKIGKKISNVDVKGPIVDYINNIKPDDFDEFIVAIPSLSGSKISNIYKLLSSKGLKNVKIMPNVSNLVDYEAHLIQTRKLNPEDLLDRKIVSLSLKESIGYLKDKRVLVTGAGGSIGSELARQLLYAGVSRLYLLGHGENSIYEIDRELRLLQLEGVGVKTNIVPIIAEIMDKDHIEHLMAQLRADIVFHAAACKHVVMSEQNPVQAVKNNVFGTLNLLSSCINNSVKRFVLISTDKVVNPNCVYAITKSICEEMMLETKSSITELMTVRFGNVFGSRGSVIPLFKKQIETGGPITLTHPDMKRYFMTIPEAASLVLKTSGIGEHRGLYLLDMGEKILIKDIILNMLKFYEYEAEKDIKIEYIGIREGEKLEEELYDDNFERVSQSGYQNINKLETLKRRFELGDFEKFLEELRPICYLGEEEHKYRNKEILFEILSKYYKSFKTNLYVK